MRRDFVFFITLSDKSGLMDWLFWIILGKIYITDKTEFMGKKPRINSRNDELVSACGENTEKVIPFRDSTNTN